MPKEAISITSFLGLYGSMDPGDVQPGMAAACEGLDPTSKRGLFTPLPEDLDVGSGTAQNATLFSDGTFAVVSDGSGVRLLTGLDTDAASESALSGSGGGQATSSGAQVHVGSGPDADPVWVGDTAFTSEGTTFDAVQGTIKNTAVMSDAEWNGSLADGEIFVAGSYYWRASLLYDAGLQESTLSATSKVLYHNTKDQGYASATIDVTVSTASVRVTGVALYRAAGSAYRLGSVSLGTEPGSALQSEYSLVEIKDYTGAGTYTFTDTYATGQTYEGRTGLPETLAHMDVRYGLGCSSQGFHLVGRVGIAGEDGDYSSQILRSKPSRYDMFDWSADYLNIRMVPVALVDFRYRVYAFSEGSVVVVDAGTLTEEERLEGVGALSAESIVVTDRGMLFASRQGIWFHNGAHITPVGQPIYYNEVVPAQGYLGQARQAGRIVCGYDACRDLFLVAVEGSNNSAWVVDAGTLGTGREVWSYFSLPAGTLTGKVQTRDGRCLLSISGTLYRLFGDDDDATGTYRDWSFRSHVLRTPGRKATYYNARLYGENVSFAYSEDGRSVQFVIFAPDTDYQEPVINSNPTPPWTDVREFWFYVTAAWPGGTDNVLRQLDLIRRVKTPR